MRLINQQKIQELLAEAVDSERKRSHLLLHRNHGEKVQRLLIALIKGSYVEPHYHDLPHQWEMFVVMEGEIEVKLYQTNGNVKSSFLVEACHASALVEFEPGDIHSVECISEHALMLEIKEGPFDPAHAKTFPGW